MSASTLPSAAAWIGNAIGPIAIDAGERGVRVTQVVRRGEDVVLERAFEIPRLSLSADGDAGAWTLLTRALRRHGFRGHGVVMTPPSSSGIADLVEVPPGPDVPADQIARAEIRRIRGDDDVEVAVWDVPGPQGGRSSAVMAAVCPNAWSARAWSSLRRGGFDLRAVRAPGPLLGRAMPTEGLWLSLDLGWSALVVRVLHGPVPVYERRLDLLGWKNITRGVADETGLAERAAEHVLRRCGLTGDGLEFLQGRETDVQLERRDITPAWQRLGGIRRMLEAHLDGVGEEVLAAIMYISRRFAGEQPGDVLVLGGGSEASGVTDWLEERLGRTIRTLTPEAMVDRVGPHAEPALGRGSFSSAVALALGGSS